MEGYDESRVCYTLGVPRGRYFVPMIVATGYARVSDNSEGGNEGGTSKERGEGDKERGEGLRGGEKVLKGKTSMIFLTKNLDYLKTNNYLIKR
jgi:hypothetical protein